MNYVAYITPSKMAYFFKALMKYREENNMATIMYVNKHMKSWYLLVSNRFNIKYSELWCYIFIAN